MSEKNTTQAPALRVEITWTPDAQSALRALGGAAESAILKRGWNAALRLAARECVQGVAARGDAAAWATRNSATPWSLDATFVCDAEMRELNARYRAKDRPTDVLSFSQAESAPDAGLDEETEPDTHNEARSSDDEALPLPLPFAWPEGLGGASEAALGDLVIAVETAQRQAEERAHSGTVEVLFLAIHGTLHLLGYDHQTSSQRVAMWREQEALFEKLRPKVDKGRRVGSTSRESGKDIVGGP